MIPYLILACSLAFVLGSVVGLWSALARFPRSVLFRREPRRWEVVE
jgi:hypothetical protein